MRTPIIAGNWKMNKTVAESLAFAKDFSQQLQQYPDGAKFEIIIAPPFTAINKMAEALKNSPIKISAQNIAWEDSGAFTGEISAPMVKEAGAEYAIIGHSERRHIFDETDSTINKKINSALNHNIIPILCIGETLEEREDERVEAVITTQVANGLMDLTAEDIKKIIVAYEPVWAIGTGKTATKELAEEVHLMIRKMLAKQFDQETADMIRILYGGSVKPNNAKELLSQPNIDGALVGGASLKPEDFMGIIKNVS